MGFGKEGNKWRCLCEEEDNLSSSRSELVRGGEFTREVVGVVYTQSKSREEESSLFFALVRLTIKESAELVVISAAVVTADERVIHVNRDIGRAGIRLRHRIRSFEPRGSFADLDESHMRDTAADQYDDTENDVVSHKQ